MMRLNTSNSKWSICTNTAPEEFEMQVKSFYKSEEEEAMNIYPFSQIEMPNVSFFLIILG